MTNLRYWTAEYIHAGPFGLISFEPDVEIVLQAYDGYFLGKPRADTIRVRLLGDSNTLLANIFAGTVDVLMDSTLDTQAYRELGSGGPPPAKGPSIDARARFAT